MNLTTAVQEAEQIERLIDLLQQAGVITEGIPARELTVEYRGWDDTYVVHHPPTGAKKVITSEAVRDLATNPRSRMTATHNTRPSGLRTYPWKGRDLLSATTLRQQLGMAYPLVQWAHKEVAAKAIDNVEELVKRCIAINDATARGAAPTAEAERAEAIAWLVAGATAKRDAAAERGKRVHSFVEQGTDLSEVPPDLTGFVQAERRAMRELGITPLLRERTVFNLTLGYAGSFDLIGLKDEVVTMIDVKTGSTGYLDHAIQLGLYVKGEFIGANDVVDQEATDILDRVAAMAILHLNEDGTYEWLDVPIWAPLGRAIEAQAFLANFFTTYPTIELLKQGASA